MVFRAAVATPAPSSDRDSDSVAVARCSPTVVAEIADESASTVETDASVSFGTNNDATAETIAGRDSSINAGVGNAVVVLCMSAATTLLGVPGEETDAMPTVFAFAAPVAKSGNKRLALLSPLATTGGRLAATVPLSVTNALVCAPESAVATVPPSVLLIAGVVETTGGRFATIALVPSPLPTVDAPATPLATVSPAVSDTEVTAPRRGGVGVNVDPANAVLLLTLAGRDPVTIVGLPSAVCKAVLAGCVDAATVPPLVLPNVESPPKVCSVDGVAAVLAEVPPTPPLLGAKTVRELSVAAAATSIPVAVAPFAGSANELLTLATGALTPVVPIMLALALVVALPPPLLGADAAAVPTSDAAEVTIPVSAVVVTLAVVGDAELLTVPDF